MTVRLGNVTFTDWVSLQYPNGWTDTFIFRISPGACVPPFSYEDPLKRMAAHANLKRPGASLWVEVDGPGDWFAAEIRHCLKGMKIPFAVTKTGTTPSHLDFSRPLRLFHSQSQPPPVVDDGQKKVSLEELHCLQALGRMVKGDEEEIASLTGLPLETAKALMVCLAEKGLAVLKTSPKIGRKFSGPQQMDLFPLWHLTSKGLSQALRSWGIPKGIDFTSRLEQHLWQIGTPHRHTSRLWNDWLKSAWPQAEIWAGWSEVQIPGLSVIPDGLAWGRIQGYETLFWLEVGDEHKGRDVITEVTAKRLDQAWRLCRRTGVRLVYAQLGADWVQEAVRWACVELPDEVAILMGNKKRFGELSLIEWGKVETL
ncbi:MAG: hypothetical protein HY865_24975 [Chloroflexi bacterium]|nr:hypothetical protein [Chloroflexota bacterium]